MLLRLFGRKPALTAEQSLALAAYRARPRLPDNSPLETMRFVVADVETTGLNPFSDRLISIGAVEVTDSRIRLGSGFEVVFRQPQASSNANILVHGIDGTTQLGGADPAAATLQFLDFAQNAPLVGFHADFDRVMIERATKAAVGHPPANPWLDLAYLAPAVMPDAARRLPRGLDEWMDLFGIGNLARHNALADALATAQLLQIVLSRAMGQGIATLSGLVKLEQDQRWLRHR
jgi:DNA polymerase-3 subunit epsilon